MTRGLQNHEPKMESNIKENNIRQYLICFQCYKSMTRTNTLWENKLQKLNSTGEGTMHHVETLYITMPVLGLKKEMALHFYRNLNELT